MTPSEIALVRESFDRIASDAETVGLEFYQELFTRDPSLRPLFAADLRTQAGHLMATLRLVVRSLSDLGPVIRQIQELGARHAAYRIKPADFDTVGAAFLTTLEKRLGSAFSPGMRAAWSTAYMTLAGTMIAAMEGNTRG